MCVYRHYTQQVKHLNPTPWLISPREGQQQIKH